jgi:hypothetical protein
MLRNDWKFDYTAAKLADAASTRAAYHRDRLAWWKGKKDQVLATIRAEGLEIDEKIVLEFASPKSRDWQDATRISVRNDLRDDLNECLKKLAHHTQQLASYTAWNEVLSANCSATYSLDHEDWQFFFGTQPTEAS